MTTNEGSRKLKTHLLFLSLLSLAFLCDIAFKMLAGKGIKAASFESLTTIRPMEAALLLAFWYSAATGKWNEGLKSNLITLNLTKK